MVGLRSNCMGLLMVIMIIGTFVQIQKSEAQTTHTVGGSLGWNVPPAGPIAYTTWAALQNFTVGDVLLFNFTNAHNVAEVTQAAFDSCNSTTLMSLATSGPASITLRTAGSHYFICTVGSHCSLGQKLAINVSSASSTPPPAGAPQPSATTPPPVSTPTPAASPASSPPPTTTMTPPTPEGGLTSPPPPPPSSAPRTFAVAALPITFLSVAIAFLY